MKKKTNYITFITTAIIGLIIGIVGILYFRTSPFFTGFLLAAFFMGFGPYLFFKFREQAWFKIVSRSTEIRNDTPTGYIHGTK